MVDLAGVVRQGVVLEAGWAVRVLACEVAHFTIECGREEHRLAVARHAPHDLVHLRLEPHVEHPVGLVEDEDPNAAQVDEASVSEILEPAGRRNEHVRALGALRLCVQGQPAVRSGHGQAFRLRQRLDLRGHLGRELARGNEHERRRDLAVRRDSLCDRHRECERLARSRRRAREDVEPRQRVREHKLLDTEGRFDLASCERVDDRARHAELAEGLGHCVRLLYGFETC